MHLNLTRPAADSFIVERRQNTKVRAVYADARVHIAHFFHADTDWVGSPIDYLAQRLLHETYPELTGHDVRTLVEAIERHMKAEMLTEFSQA